MKKHFDGAYWGSSARNSLAGGDKEIWFEHSKWNYQRLLERWFTPSGDAVALKTDLFDEAVTPHNLVPLIESRCARVIGMDISFEVARSATERLTQDGSRRERVLVSDARRQAFLTGTFDYIVSNSTLDHFEESDDLIKSLRELERILKPGGVLIITLDNPLNPVVFLRNHLPYGLLKRLGIINFYVGATLSRPKLVRTLESMGLRVEEQSVIIHAPRIIALRIGSVIERFKSSGLRRSYLAVLRLFECLGALPTRDLTGYFVAVKAVKRRDGGRGGKGGR